MKRLYVRPRFRGKHIGEQLVKKIIADVREIGYQHMLLDTLPPLKSAIYMYRKLGFYDISCYNDSPIDTTIFMQLDLERGAMKERHLPFFFCRMAGKTAKKEAPFISRRDSSIESSKIMEIHESGRDRLWATVKSHWDGSRECGCCPAGSIFF